ncbi:MAG: hypothetical protein AAF357_19300, partial [Verrucomicrobiota bacterium]
MPPRRSSSSENQPELPLFDDLKELIEQPHSSAAENPSPTNDQPTPKNGITHHFTGWDRPILATVANFLMSTAANDRLIDLSSLLIVVPTRHAGRRLREALALEASAQSAAVFPPLVVTEEFFVSPDRIPNGDPIADREATRLIWAALLLDLDLREFRCVFPVDPIERDLTWAMKTADELLEVRHLLTESGLTFATASDPLSDHDMEPLRWKELAKLESIAIRRTHDLRLRDDALSRIDAAQSGNLPGEIARILVASSPDLSPLGSIALEQFATRFPVEILVHAPESAAFRFDAWGRPLPNHWIEAEIDIPDPTNSILDAASPTHQAERACDLIGNVNSPAALAAIGVPDPEVISPLEQSASLRGWSTYDPAGQPVSHHGIYYLLDQTAALLATRSFEAVTRLLRCPDLSRALVSALPPGETGPLSATAFIALVDDLRERCLPDRLEDALTAA